MALFPGGWHPSIPWVVRRISLTIHQDEVPDDEADEDEAPDEDGPMDDDNEARGRFGTSIFLEVGYNPPKTNMEPQNQVGDFQVLKVNFSGCTLGYKTSRRIPLITRIIISISLVRDPFSDLYFPHFTTRGSMPKYIDNWKHNDSCPFLGGTTRRFF